LQKRNKIIFYLSGFFLAIIISITISFTYVIFQGDINNKKKITETFEKNKKDKDALNYNILSLIDAIDTGGLLTNPVSFSFILGLGLVFGWSVFITCRQILLYYYQRAVVMHRYSPKESLRKYWGRSYFVGTLILSLFSSFSLCSFLIKFFGHYTFDTGRLLTQPFTVTFILGLGLIFGVVVFITCRQISLFFYQRAVVMHRNSPRESLQKYWGKSCFVRAFILSLLSGFSLCAYLNWFFMHDPF